MMKRRILIIVLSIILFSVNLGIAVDAAQAEPETAQTKMTDDASMPHYKQALQLKALGLFNGTDKGFELDRGVTRVEAGVMLVRLLGKEKVAGEAKYAHPFKDVPGWANAYVGYMYHTGLTGGISPTEFGSGRSINSAQYMTFVLRALDYDDKKGDFVWNNAVNAAYDWGIIGETDHKYYNNSSDFLRDDMVNISAKALDRGLKGQPKKRLINMLIGQGSISEQSAREAGFATEEGLFSPLEFGDIDGISQINPKAFNMEIEKTEWRNQYKHSIKNIRIQIDRSKLADGMKDFTNLCLYRNWTGKMDQEALSAFLKTGTKRFLPLNSYEIDDEGWLMMMLGAAAYDVLLLADGSNRILGYLVIRYHFDEDTSEYADLSDRYALLDKGIINGMKSMRKVSLTRYEGKLKVLFDKTEMPEAVYETVEAFYDKPHDLTYPDSNRIEASIAEYSEAMEKELAEADRAPEINEWIPHMKNGRMSSSDTYNLSATGWGKNLCLYVVYDKDCKPVGYAIIEKTRALMH